ncbi:streptamidine family RiPP [Pseudonocardia hispaniensis]|uniref:Streptamidine family RiPP n=1 Tax=Pseudonocardia hispaniensis TaxID=904933 RepID=A0ABW1J634_9PSEU
MEEVFVLIEAERALPHNSASHSNALVENPFETDDSE